jgi:hypothetical protein
MIAHLRGPRFLLATLITIATVMFIVGVIIERSQPDQHAGEPVAQPHGTSESHTEQSGGEGEESHAATLSGESRHETHEEPRLLGINPESTPLVVLASIGSLLLVAAVLLRPNAAPLLALVALAMLAFAALDVREVAHQLDDDHTAIAILAAAVAALHLAAAGVAIAQTRAQPNRQPTPSS